jgi:hypothetical protein
MAKGSLQVYRTCTPVVDVTYDEQSPELPTKVLVDAIAEANNSNPVEMPPLYEFVDPDMIEHLLEQRDNQPEREMILGFTVESWNVFVRSDGRIRICDGTQHTDPQPVFAGNSLGDARASDSVD